MISLIRLLFNLGNREPLIEMRRMPAARVLRVQPLGLTVGLFAVLTLLAESMLVSHMLPFWRLIGLALIFLAGSVLGGRFVLLAAAAAVVALVRGISAPGADFSTAVLYVSLIFTYGFGFGALLAILYNDALFLLAHYFFADRLKSSFSYDRMESINIIKSPVAAEETGTLEFLVQNLGPASRATSTQRARYARLLRRYMRRLYRVLDETARNALLASLARVSSGSGFNARLKEFIKKLMAGDATAAQLLSDEFEQLLRDHLKPNERRLYDYSLPAVSPHPYTIAFVANPWVLTRRAAGVDYESHRSNPANYEPDPILDDRELFLRSVDRALYSLERDEVVGRPEIWSRIRVLTIFPDQIAHLNGPDHGLVEQFQDSLIIDGGVIENLLDPMRQMTDSVQRFLASLPQTHLPSDIALEHIDVIYGLSAAPLHDRSSAHFSDWLEDATGMPPTLPTDPAFTYNQDPSAERPKGDQIEGFQCRFPNECRHEQFAVTPGRIALNVVGARQKTYIHEFAHAMSSAWHGAIVDEYADLFEVDLAGPTPPGPPDPPFFLNRIERNATAAPPKLIPVHKIFADFNDVRFHSDLDHPSAEEGWHGYFPQRADWDVGCTMDRTIGHYQFDNLISAFMYDRLVAKLNRP